MRAAGLILFEKFPRRVQEWSALLENSFVWNLTTFNSITDT